MNIIVLMASGETDVWEGAADAIDSGGSLMVLGPLGDEVPNDTKTVIVSREVVTRMQPRENSGRLEMPLQALEEQEFQLMSVYAPGMWIKVEFE